MSCVIFQQNLNVYIWIIRLIWKLALEYRKGTDLI